MLNLPSIFQNKAFAVEQLCLENKVEKLYLFGSALTADFSKKSDVDLIIEIEEKNPILKGEILMKTWSELESIFQRKVDLLTSINVKNPILKKSIEANIQLIYDRKN
ncbi:MAG TPA: DNA polymerase subunit beta [Flavobacterium sp.]|nr:DNA polymerase subunit beta [Flavobacterium sp.]HAT81292.1 DNA polymerase subunit beta [Flavobacterium sp.]